MQILIIEDDPGISELLSRKLQENGFETRNLHSGAEAVAFLEAHKPYLMILDYSLPDMRGSGFIAELKRKGLAIPPFIVVTGQGDERIAVEMMKLGARDYVIKDNLFFEILPGIVKKIGKEIENEKNLQKALEQLWMSEKLNQTILNGISTNIAYANTVLEIIWANRAAAESVKKTPDEMIGKPCYLFWGNGIDVCENCPSAAAIESKKTEQKVVTTPDGRIWDESGEPVLDAEGEVIGVIEIAREITEYRKKESLIRQQNEMLRGLFDSLAEGICIISDSGSFIRINSYFTMITGYSDTDLNTIDDWFKLAFPAAEPREKVVTEWSKALAKRESVYREYSITCKNGDIRDIGLNAGFLSDGISIVALQDITERKRSEESLRESELRWQFAVDGNDMGLWDWDVLTDKAMYSHQWKAMLGYGDAEISGDFNEWEKRVHPDDLKNALIDLERHFKGLTPIYLNEFRMLCKDGSYKWILARGKVISWDEQGKPLRVIGTHMDITERKKSEDALKESENRFRIVMKGSPIIFSYFDRDLRYTWIQNPHPDFNPESLLGKRDDEVAQNPGVQKMVQFKRRIIENGVAARTEITLPHSDGDHTYDISAEPLLNERGEITGGTAIGFDITNRKKAEEALRASEERLLLAVNSVKLGIWEQDLQTGDVKWNNYMYHIYGVDKSDYIVTHESVMNFTHPEDRERILSQVENVLKNGQDFESQFRIITPLGETRYIRAYAHVYEFIDGKPSKIIGVNNDITDQVNAYNTIIRNQRLNAIGEFAAGVAHDFNNSLESIMGNIELMLLNSEISDENRENLTSMKKSVRDAAARIRKLQSFNKPESGQRNYNGILLNQVVIDVIAQTRPLWKDTAEQKGIFYVVNKNLNDIPKVSGDENELRSVLYNLIKNAIEAMPHGGTLNVSTEHDKKDVIVRVMDNGTGMDDDTVKKLFQPYFTTKGFEQGRGLGLPGVLSVIQAHGGQIFVERTAPGEGTVIQFRLPISDAQTKPDKKTEQPQKPEFTLNVLWVDDEISIRLLGQRRLKMLGHSTDIAGNGEEALELMKKNRYNLVITDIGMPVMNGWQLAERVRREYGDTIPIAILSGGGDDRVNDENIRGKVNYFLKKPIEMNELAQVLKEVSELK